MSVESEIRRKVNFQGGGPRLGVPRCAGSQSHQSAVKMRLCLSAILVNLNRQLIVAEQECAAGKMRSRRPGPRAPAPRTAHTDQFGQISLL